MLPKVRHLGHSSLLAEVGIRVALQPHPFPKPRSLPKRLLAKWRAMGWSQIDAAKVLGVDRSVRAKWERGSRVAPQVRRCARFLLCRYYRSLRPLPRALRRHEDRLRRKSRTLAHSPPRQIFCRGEIWRLVVEDLGDNGPSGTHVGGLGHRAGVRFPVRTERRIHSRVASAKLLHQNPFWPASPPPA